MSNNAPLIKLDTGDSASVMLTETDAGLTANGTLTLFDPDETDTVGVTVTGVLIVTQI